MTTKAKPILDNKLWLIETDGEKIGTLSVCDDRYMFSNSNTTCFFSNDRQLKKHFGDFAFDKVEHDIDPVDKSVHGFPTNCVPYQPVFDVKRKLPLFSKSNKSKSYYCAGYYIIRFDKGWVKSFCPKLITVERYETRGPFKTELEMKQELNRANR